MARGNFVQTSFLGGLWTKFAQGGMDDPNYKKALAVCLNGLPIEEQCWVRRSGTQVAGHTRAGAAARLQEFAFTASAPYNVEYSDSFIRLWAGATLVADDTASVTSISNANPGVLTIGTSKGWATSAGVYFTFGDAASTALAASLANRQFVLIRLTGTTYTLRDPLTGTDVDGATINFPLTGMTVTANHIREIASPYTAALFPTVRAIQSDLQLLLLQSTISPRALVAVPGSPFATFALSTPKFLDGPYLDPPTDGSTITPSAKTGSVTLTASAITAINSGTGFQTTDVGRLVRLYSQPAAFDVGHGYSVADVVLFNGVTYYCIQGGTGHPPDQSPTFWSISPALARWSWAKITAWSSTTVVTATIMGPDLPFTNAMTIWRLGVYSDTTGYPTCGCYHEGRIWLGGAVVNRFDASYVNGFTTGSDFNFAPTDQFGVVSDANGISYILNSAKSNAILWMQPGASGIDVGTEAAEWLISASDTNGVLTPTSIQAHPVTAYGCANIEPRRTGLTIVFVQKHKRKLLEYLADTFSGKFYGPNLSARAKGVTKSGILELAFQEELAPVVWMRLGDGNFAGTTYRRNSSFSTQPPEFNGWHQHALGSGRTVEYISAGPAQIEAGEIDTLAMITTDASGIRYFELLRPLFDEEDAITSAWFVDSGIVPSNGTTVQGGNAIQFFGLHHLEGKIVSAFIGGVDCGDYTVANASIVVPYGSAGGVFTKAFLSGLTTSGTDFGDMECVIDRGALVIPAVIGFTYTSQGQLLRPVAPADTGAQTGPAFAKSKRAAQAGFLLKNAVQGIKFGTDFTKLRPSDFRNKGKSARIPVTQFFDGVYKPVLDDANSYDSQLCWQIDRPYPCTIVAAGNFEETEDV